MWQAFEPIPISEVANKLGLQPEDYDLYGTTKAKARLLRPKKPHDVLKHSNTNYILPLCEP